MSNRKLTALGALGVALCALSAVAASVDPVAPANSLHATISVATVAALLGVGLYAWHRGGEGRFGQVLYATGVCWFFVTLSNSDAALLYSVGRIAGWVFEVLLAYALLSYPTGRLESRGARLVIIAGALLIGLLYVPTIPWTDQYPLPAPFTSCTAHCPQNFFLASSEPGLVTDVIRPLRDALAITVYLGAVWVLAARLRLAGPNLRRTLVPVLSAAVLRFVAAIVYVTLRRAGADGVALEAAVLVALLSVPATALGFLVGLVQWRIYSGGALGRLTTGLAETGDPGELRDLLALALEEPALELFYAPPADPGAGAPSPGAPSPWLDAAGAPCADPAPSPRTCLRAAEADSGLRVAVICDEGFRDRPEFLDAVCSCVVSGLERQRLDAALSASLADVAASRKRLVGAADGARRRIERDLHDGAQQQLVTLRIKLELAREALEQGSPKAGAMVAGLGPEVDEIIDEVRALARGIYPPLLSSDGLGEALRAAGRRSPVPVTIAADGIGRLPAEAESAVYFCCLEALQNVAKHATGARAVAIGLARDGDQVRFEVADDGCGFLAGGPDPGSGITGMRDRLAAVGGELRVESAPGAGTRVRGRIALD
ncbi:MAG TPA: histidine kinase [Solirubrobacterales bacterium]|nr:histidine kinase [Solirubrobacterales bacterium]